MQDIRSVLISAHNSVAVETEECCLPSSHPSRTQIQQKLGTSCLFVDPDVIVAAFGVEPPPTARCEKVWKRFVKLFRNEVSKASRSN